MLKKTLMAGVAATVLIGAPLAAFPAFAQTAPSATAPAGDSIKADKLVGHKVVNARDETVGDINAVYLGSNGTIDSVIVGVGGFIGIGEREVALKWSDLTVTNNGDKIVVNATKEQLKAMPEYKYSDTSYRGKVFSSTGVNANPPAVYTRTDRADMARDGQVKTPGMAATTDGKSVDGKKHNPAISANGSMSGNAIIGADVKNASNETIGTVQDIFIGKDGAVKGVIVAVGGFLGIGERNVMLSWDKVQLRGDSDNDGLVIMTDATKDSLKSMPEYKQSSL